MLLIDLRYNMCTMMLEFRESVGRYVSEELVCRRVTVRVNDCVCVWNEVHDYKI